MALLNKQTGELISEEKPPQSEEQTINDMQTQLLGQILMSLEAAKEVLTNCKSSTENCSEKMEQLLAASEQRNKEQPLLQQDLIAQTAAKLANTFDVYCARVTHQRIKNFEKKIADISSELDKAEAGLRRVRRPVTLLLSLSLNVALAAIVAALIVILLK